MRRSLRHTVPRRATRRGLSARAGTSAGTGVRGTAGISAGAAAALAALLVVSLAGAAAPAQAQSASVGGPLPQPLPVLPPDNWWNIDISGAPVDPGSAAFIGWIGGGTTLHPDLGGDVDPNDPSNPNIYGFPYISVPGTQPLVPVTFVLSPDESDTGAPGHGPGYPIPPAAETQPKWIEGGAAGGGTSDDYHMLIVDRDNRILYELYQAHWNVDHWEAGSGAIFQLDSDARRPQGWTSADAAGLAIFPGLIRYDEAAGSAPIKHAFRFTLRDSNGYVYPASHVAGSNPQAPPLGTRLRLKASVDLSRYSAQDQRIFQAMKTYGLIVADNGSDMYIQGTYDTRWDNGVMNPEFGTLTASDFEVVKLGWQPAPAPAGPRRFYPLAPCRLLDTRNADGPYGGPAVPPGSQRIVAAAGQCGIPAAARALAVNLTVVSSPQGGYMTLFAGDAAVPPTSSISFASGQLRANNAVVALASSGSGTFGIYNATASQSAHVLVDVSGYFQ